VTLSIRGAREHNLRDLDLDLPTGKLIVFCGPSGSGKSSLAWDTLHAESQRRFVEALSSSVRAAFGATRKPAFDRIEGLTPSIGVAQRGQVAPSARETVATLTEVHDLAQVLFARCGVQHCPTCGVPLPLQTLDVIVRTLAGLPDGTRVEICATVARGRSGGIKPLLAELARQGVARIRLDGRTFPLDEAPAVDARLPHTLDVVVDRIVTAPDRRDRLNEAVDTALRMGRGTLVVAIAGEDCSFATRPYCVRCDRLLPDLAPRLFSYASPLGACAGCQGLGRVREVDEALLVQPGRSLREGAVATWRGQARRLLEAAAEKRGIDLDTPWSSLPWEARDWVLSGDDEAEGARRAAVRANLALREGPCGDCAGARLGEAARNVRIGELTLPAWLALDTRRAADRLGTLPDGPILGPLRHEIARRLAVLLDTGLGYVALDRAATTLSTGELQRVRLAAQAGNQLSGVLYVLDEPTAGLHPREVGALVGVLRRLRDAGNTVLAVEHDPDVILAADHVVEFGPGAGVEGGRVVYAGPPGGMRDTPTGRWLRGQAAIEPSAREPSGWLAVRGARGNNLRNLDVRLPLGVLAGVCGVSGSGKSTLVLDTLAARLSGGQALAHDGIDGAVARVVRVDARPIGRSTHGTVASALGVWEAIRKLLAATPEAKVRGFGPERFSLARPGGRCEACAGEGTRRVAMVLLPDVFVPCEVCDGQRFDEATLAVSWRGWSPAALLSMPVRRSRALFAALPAISEPLGTLDHLGLGYLLLGQGTDTLSGGEAQRVKLAQHLGRPGELAGALYLLDEPSVGLHPSDVALLVDALRRLVAAGASVLVVDHDPVLLGACDWLTELGPGSGVEGGRLVREGRPEPGDRRGF
jgi:excinuclease ABC subunit A